MSTEKIEASETLAESAEARAEKLGNQRAARGWRWHLETFRGRRAILFAYMFIVHIYYPLKNNYFRKYGAQQSAPASRSPTKENSSKRVQVMVQTASVVEPTRRGPPVAWRWQSFPQIWRVLVWYRIACSTYFVYVVVKNVCPVALEAPIRYLINPSKPVDCYLLGRFIPNYVSRATASCFATYHLIWRYFQVHKPVPKYMISTIYFLLLDDRDIRSYYKLLDQSQRSTCAIETAELKVSRERVADKREQMFHDIMSARVEERGSMAYKLRPNRTPEASRLLRKYLADSTIFWIAIFIPLAGSLTLLMIWTGFKTTRYLEVYPGCSPAIQELVDRGQLDNSWTLHLRWHYIIALMSDTLENGLLWLESGLTGVFSVPLSMLFNYDLVLYWEYLDRKVDKILEQTRRNQWLTEIEESKQLFDSRKSDSSIGSSLRSRYYKRRRPNSDGARDKLIYEFQMEWQDFIKQIERSDAFVGEAVSVFLFVWFSLLCVFIYETLSSHQGTMPWAANLTLFWIVAVVTSHCAALSILHRQCLGSYTKICSLMAYDRSVHRLNFIQIMDYFVKQRTCFTLYRRHKMTATTYLTIVGWSFSCYFVLGSINKRN